MATLRPRSVSVRASSSTTGVFPVPPTVMLPTLTTSVPSLACLAMLEWNRYRRISTTSLNSQEAPLSTRRIIVARNPLARPKMTSVPHSSNSSDLDFMICRRRVRGVRQ